MEEDFNALIDMLIMARRLNESTYRGELMNSIKMAIEENKRLSCERMEVVSIDILLKAEDLID